MGLFKRAPADNTAASPSGPGLSELLMQGEDMLEQLAEAHRTWGLGTADRWDLDQTTGIISWTFPDKVATAPAQIIGSYAPRDGSWLWAWANPSILPEMSRASARVRDWAAANGHPALAEAKLEADESMVDTLSALALRITEATGFYRAPTGASYTVMTFGAVTLTAADGTMSTFAIEIG